jgi:hypothetical protein
MDIMNSSAVSQQPSNKQGLSGTVMLQGVVVEVLNDPSFYSDDQLLEIFNNIANTSCLSGDPTQQAFIPDQDSPSALRYLIPRGSLLVKIVSEGLGKASDTNHLCFPFFPPHLQLPIKPGERVWVFSDKPGQNLTNVYWMCRITAPGFVDDINYTHIDRSILPSPDETPSFPNGNDTADRFTIPDAEGFENIVNDSESMISFTPEAVPRINRRPGDLVLQGSNNATILLSDDRGWGSSDTPSSSETSNVSKSTTEIEKSLAGSIDIVTGRGRFLSSVDEDPSGTAPRIVENSRGEQETDKFFVNPIEGDPDFVTDSSRVYVSMNTSGDEKLGLTYPQIDGASVETVSDSPYVIVKSDEVRIVARKDSTNSINGSIKIVKEGEDGTDRAVIVIQPDGSIMIDGPKISIGSGTTDDKQVLIGNDSGADHLVMGETLQGLLEGLIDAITAISVPTGVGPSGPPANAADFISIKSQLSTMLSKVGRTK